VGALKFPGLGKVVEGGGDEILPLELGKRKLGGESRGDVWEGTLKTICRNEAEGTAKEMKTAAVKNGGTDQGE